MTIDITCPFDGDTRIYGHKVRKRIEEIEEVVDGYDEDDDADVVNADIALTELVSAEEVVELRKELVDLKSLIGECGHDAHLIREDDFEAYAREFASEIGALNADATWPNDHIDWEAASKALAQDFSTFGLMGTSYYYQNNN